MLRSDDRLRFGAAYAFEHWPQRHWAIDLGLLREAGLGFVRWGAGIWPAVQPTPDTYDCALPDRVVDACREAGLGLIFDLPVMERPTWLTGGDRDRLQVQALALVRMLVGRYQAASPILAWVLDAGFARVEIHQQISVEAMPIWLQQRYGGRTAMALAWGLGCIDSPSEVIDQALWLGSGMGENPFRNADVIRFSIDQGVGITSAIAGAARNAGAKVLVLDGLDKKPDFGRQTLHPTALPSLMPHFDAYGHRHHPSVVKESERVVAGRAYAAVRAHASRLWALEQQASQTGDAGHRRPLASPGSIGLTALQSIGHGANLLCWDPWRSVPSGPGLSRGGILPAWGEPGRHYEELRDLAHMLEPHAEIIAATRPQIHVARLLGPEQHLLHRVEPWVAEQVGDPRSGRLALADLDLNEDELPPAALKPGSGYLVALLPHAVGITAAEVANLRAWVYQGGVLVVGPLAGHRGEGLRAPIANEPPGVLAELTGTSNTEATTWDGKLALHGSRGGSRFEAGAYGEIVQPIASLVAVMATHDSGWLAGKPAITKRELGAGSVIHCGVAFTDAVLRWLWTDLNLPKPDPVVVTHDATVEVLVRHNHAFALHVVLNHGSGPAVCSLFRPVRDLISGEELTSSFTLQPKGWRLLRQELG